MKISGRNIKRRLALWSDRLSRTKHFRGHGVHSPFAYGLVRKVFMRRTLYDGSGTSLYDALRERGVAERRAIQLHNARLYCAADTWSIDSTESDFVILTKECSSEQLIATYGELQKRGAIVVILSPYANRERQERVATIVTSHRSTSIDNRAYIILMNNHLPKQHFKL